MKKYIIDGNNLIGKIKSLSILQKKDKQAAREKLAHLIERYFSNKKVKIILNFDGFPSEKINLSKVKLIYSKESTADDKIREQITAEKNKRNISVISSDNQLREFAKVCGCEGISSEDFGKRITKTRNADDEESRIKTIDDINSFKKIFGLE